jgi:hypothetical protein
MSQQDPDFVKYLDSIKNLSAEHKAVLRNKILSDAGMGVTPRKNPLFVIGKPKGLREPGNLDLNGRPVVHNDDGTHSSEFSTSFGTDDGEVLVPTIVNGRFLSVDGKKPAPGSYQESDMINRAREHYLQTGEHMGIFDTPENADAYATDVHNRTLTPAPTTAPVFPSATGE